MESMERFSDSIYTLVCTIINKKILARAQRKGSRKDGMATMLSSITSNEGRSRKCSCSLEVLIKTGGWSPVHR